MAETKYGKKLVIETSDGPVTLEGNAAREMQRRLEDSKRYFWLTTDKDAGVVTFYNVDSAACGFCKVATLTPTKSETEAIPCEDALPDCDGNEDEKEEP